MIPSPPTEGPPVTAEVSTLRQQVLEGGAQPNSRAVGAGPWVHREEGEG